MNKDEKSHVPGLIFRNQPSYTHFNKSFDDPADALFQQLNDVHPIFWKAEELQKRFEYNVLLDPRTKKEVTKVLHDHTRAERPHMEIIRNERYSKMNKKYHITCIRVLTAWLEMTHIDEEDVLQWRRRQFLRSSEKIEFDKVVKEYEQVKKVAIYAPTERLVKLYKTYYAAKMKLLFKDYPENLALNTHAGLPLPQSLKIGLGNGMQIKNVRLLKRQGWVSVLKDYAADLVRLNARLENYMDYYVNSIEVETEEEWNVNKGVQLMHYYYIPLESLLFLLTAGTSVDLPTEVSLEIDDNEESGFKIFKFKKPLPPRNCGWYTHKYVVEKAFETLLNASEDTQWLYVENNIAKLQERVEVPEINAVKTTTSDFQPQLQQQYMQKYSIHTKKDSKANSAIIEWNLSSTNDEHSSSELKVFTRLKLVAAKDTSGKEFLSSYALKLEYKPQFGAELLTKYELLQEWFRLKLMSQCKGFSEHGLCLRIAVNNFTVQLEHNLILASIEQQLDQLYQVHIPQLLAGLADILKLLGNMPKGKYFLRYNPKYPEKLLLAKPSTEITSNTVFLHTLINAEPSDMLFMTNMPHLPISDTLCTVIHRRYNIMPCAFKHILHHQCNFKVPKKVKTDEEWRQARLKAKLMLKQKKEDHLKRLKRARNRKIKAERLKRSKKQQQAEIAKTTELERLINEC
ncbi:little elongation complex subunit 2 [Eurosta solidaginis]|uniref:little elongation complex subunit 2 n=1 Tax=Eurosta solidaginis TaxID=178769 RepID=UPI003530D0B4